MSYFSSAMPTFVPPDEGSRANNRRTSETDSTTSYEKAVLSSDALWEWQAEEEVKGDWKATREHVMPKHVTSPSSHSPPTSYYKAPRPPELGTLRTGIDIVQSSPTNVRVGFYPTSSIDATDPAELPGSRQDIKVITIPPHPSTRISPISTTPNSKSSPVSQIPRVESIEDADKKRENYVPQLPRRELNFGGGRDDGEAEPNAFCLGLASFIGSPSGVKQYAVGADGLDEETLLSGVRKYSSSPSELSNVSVSCNE